MGRGCILIAPETKKDVQRIDDDHEFLKIVAYVRIASSKLMGYNKLYVVVNYADDLPDFIPGEFYHLEDFIGKLGLLSEDGKIITAEYLSREDFMFMLPDILISGGNHNASVTNFIDGYRFHITEKPTTSSNDSWIKQLTAWLR